MAELREIKTLMSQFCLKSLHVMISVCDSIVKLCTVNWVTLNICLESKTFTLCKPDDTLDLYCVILLKSNLNKIFYSADVNYYLFVFSDIWSCWGCQKSVYHKRSQAFKGVGFHLYLCCLNIRARVRLTFPSTTISSIYSEQSTNSWQV